MKLVGIAGWSGSGKTTLIERLLPRLLARGLSVSVIKHAHHDFDIDRPGKDSHRHREAGAHEVLITSGRRWALQHELRGASEPTLSELVARLAPCDLVLVEGFKREPIAKVEVHRVANGKPLLFPDDPHVTAVATDLAAADVAAAARPHTADATQGGTTTVPRHLCIDDIEAIAAFVADGMSRSPSLSPGADPGR